MSETPIESARVTVTSDLHLFTHRTTAHDAVEILRDATASSDVLVLNGDVFDFRWSVLGGEEATATAAEAWLRDLLDATKQRRVLYLLGNHDATPRLVEHCERIAAQVPRFAWSPDFARLGDVLFTHGDLLQGRAPSRERRVDGRLTPRPRWQGRVYAGGPTSAIVWAVGAIRSRRLSARSVARRARALADVDPELLAGVRRLCVGHTHLEFSGLHVGDLQVFNTGASVRGARSEVLDLHVDRAAIERSGLWPECEAPPC